MWFGKWSIENSFYEHCIYFFHIVISWYLFFSIARHFTIDAIKFLFDKLNLNEITNVERIGFKRSFASEWNSRLGEPQRMPYEKYANYSKESQSIING